MRLISYLLRLSLLPEMEQRAKTKERREGERPFGVVRMEDEYRR